MDPVATAGIHHEQKIDAVTNTTVTAIDAKAKQVILSDSRSLGYGALLLATGAQPVHLRFRVLICRTFVICEH